MNQNTKYHKKEKSLVIADEISPDSCRLWDRKTKSSLDKDLFRENKGDLISAYNKIHNKLSKV